MFWHPLYRHTHRQTDRQTDRERERVALSRPLSWIISDQLISLEVNAIAAAWFPLPNWAFTRYDRRTDWSARPRLRPTGRSEQSDRPVGQTVAEPPISLISVNQINVACWLISHHSCIWQLQLCSYEVSNKVPPTLQRDWSSDWPVGPTSRTYSVHTLRQSDRQSDEIKHPTVCPTGRMKRLHDTIVGPTSRTDQSDRPVGPTIVPCKRPVIVATSCCYRRLRFPARDSWTFNLLNV